MSKIQSIFETVRRAGKNAVLLESGQGLGGWSFIGIVNDKVRVPAGEKGPLFMREFLRKNKRRKKISSPPFSAGFAGFLSYDLGAEWQGIKSKKSACPDIYFVYVDEVIAVKGERSKFAGRGSWAGHAPALGFLRNRSFVEPKSNLSRREYFQKIRAIKNYLYSGDTYQANFSQRFSARYFGSAFDIYKRAASINPSPFQFFLETPNFAIASNSPERLFKIWTSSGGEKFIETRPIKGTVPRGRSARQDAANIQKLLASKKEKAELEMIVDLERNDLGKICVPGTVEVTKNRAIEKYSHVIHTVSDVRGRLTAGRDFYDALLALFPGGSVTGCPKRRTMEIIHKLEAEPRGVYCGSAGWIDLSGECDFNIMIRTLWLNKKKNRLIFRSGGGIVADSMPEKEYEETMHKAKALMKAITTVLPLAQNSKWPIIEP